MSLLTGRPHPTIGGTRPKDYPRCQARTRASLAKEGWTRHQVNGPVPLTGADGVVRSTSNNRWLERNTPSAPAKEASPLFLNGRSHPSFAKEYSELSCWPAP